MRYAGVVVGITILDALTTAFRFKMNWTEGLGVELVVLGLISLLAVLLWKTVMRKRIGGTTPLFGFRELVITISLVFAAICANAGSQLVQTKVFGHTYTPSYADPKPLPGSTEKPIVRSVPAKIAEMAASVSAEEISARWIAFGALLMLVPPGWALFLSSLLFGLQHTVIPILGGTPEIGWFRIAPTFFIGIFSGIAFMRSGLAGAIFIHLAVNMIGLFAENHTYIADGVILVSAVTALTILPLMLLSERLRRPVLRRQLRFNLSSSKS